MATLLSRTRSGRVPANSGRPMMASASSNTASAQSGGSSSSSSQIPTTSNISLFLTNLRLLDLDLLPDWPDITTSTFSTRDAGQSQKKRIQCVEWALFQLFALWDLDEARSKLQSYFPPGDQVQSVNLRAALVRALEQAKKNGVLGRDVIIRKTMLDECKGERLEEVLAVFSSAVLKKLAAEDQLNSGAHPAVAQVLALENRGYSSDRTALNALILAHKASLGGILREKQATRAKFKDFSGLLDLKHQSIARRREHLKALDGQASSGAAGDISEDVKLDTWRTVRNNWSGNERWMETLLYGDANARCDGLLSQPYDRVWRKVQSGQLGELQDRSGGLLEQLDSRVRIQRERLEQWENFRQRMFGKATRDRSGTGEKQSGKERGGIDLGFRAHESLYLGRMSPRKLTSSQPLALGSEYTELIQGLEAEFQQISSRASGQPLRSLLQAQRASRPERWASTRPSTQASADEAVSEISELEDEPSPPLPAVHQHRHSKSLPQSRRESQAYQQAQGKAISGTTLSPVAERQPRPSLSWQSPTAEAGTPKPLKSLRPLKVTKAPSIAPPPPLHIPSPPLSPSRPVVHTPSPVRSTPRPPRQQEAQAVQQRSPERSVSPTQQLADQILASMDTASPSPVKKPRHTLSLAERTRLSMARVSHVTKLEEEDDEPELSTPGIQRNTNLVPSTKVTSLDDAEEDQPPENGYEDLVARTRRSMAGFEAARQKAQLERRRSQRKSRHVASASMSRREGSSYFPTVDEGEGDSTMLLAEELISTGQDDPETIFMSRPKLKTSPAPSPMKMMD